MLFAVRMRVLSFTVGLAALVACGEPDTNYGEPSGIIGKKLPGGGSTSSPGPGGSTSEFDKPYAAADDKPTTTLKAAHEAKGGPAPDTIAQPCVDCHKTGGQAESKVFAFGGRIIGKKPDVDVMVKTSSAKVGPTKTDADGFYWMLGASIPANAKPVVRSAENEESGMSATISTETGGGCDAATCHGGGQGPAGKLL